MVFRAGLVSAALFGVAAAASCTFPDITYITISSSSATSSATSASGGGATTTSSGAQGGGGASTTTSSSAGGGTASGGGGVGGAGGEPPCDPSDCTVKDQDGDGEDNFNCGGTDCDDCDGDVFSGQTDWFIVPSKHNGFDYNCSTMVEPEFSLVACTGIACPTTNNTFLGAMLPKCGDFGVYGTCNAVCQQKNTISKQLRCH